MPSVKREPEAAIVTDIPTSPLPSPPRGGEGEKTPQVIPPVQPMDPLE